MLASPLPSGGLPADEWRFEMKWDGIRAICEVRDGAALLWSRNGNDVTSSFPELTAELPSALQGVDGVVDGEIVAMDTRGRPSFERLQGRLGVTTSHVATRRGHTPVHLMLFDMLDNKGKSLVDLPYVDRRALLESIVVETALIHVPPTYGTDVVSAMAFSKEHGLEGVVAKLPQSPYRPGIRSPSWCKVKHQRFQEVVVVAWVDATSGGLGSLVVAVPRGDGTLRYAGRVGTGFTDPERRALEDTFTPLARATAVLDDLPRDARAQVHWVEPTLVGEVRFSEWTSAGRMRHPSWRGLRRDKSPADVLAPEVSN
jgi:bifunctional non-homologous end joining protein LigD